MKILIVEDEHRLSAAMAEYLTGEGYLCEQAHDYAQARTHVAAYDYDCVLLDLMLPGGSGLDVLRLLRERQKEAGVIIVSAKGSTEDKVRGLEIGADDYLAKPFHLEELAMRVYAVIRRKEFAGSNQIDTAGIHIDLREKTASVRGCPLTLTKSEYQLLLFLVCNRGRVVSKSAMAEHLTGEMADMMDSHDFVYSHVKNLKAKLAAAGVADCIHNVYGMGYRWKT